MPKGRTRLPEFCRAIDAHKTQATSLKYKQQVSSGLAGFLPTQNQTRTRGEERRGEEQRQAEASGSKRKHACVMRCGTNLHDAIQKLGCREEQRRRRIERPPRPPPPPLAGLQPLVRQEGLEDGVRQQPVKLFYEAREHLYLPRDKNRLVFRHSLRWTTPRRSQQLRGQT